MADRKKMRFNVIDVIIVILIIGAITGIILRYNIVGKLVSSSSRDKVSITVLVTGVKPALAESIKDGEDFYIESKKFGTLASHNAENSVVYKTDEEGNIIRSSDPSLNDVTTVFTAEGVIDPDGSFKLAGSRFLAAGKTVTLQSMHVQLEGVILSIEQIK